MLMYRVLHATSSWLLDECEVKARKEEPLEEWMTSMRFQTATDAGSGCEPVHFAAMTGRANIVEALLDRGASVESAVAQGLPNFQLHKGATPLAIAAVYARDASVIELLLRRGADPRTKVSFQDWTAIGCASFSGNIEGVKALMRHDPTLSEVIDNIGMPPLGWAFVCCHVKLVSWLRDEYPRQFEDTVRLVDMTRHNGYSLITAAIGIDTAHVAMLKMFVDAGGRVDSYAPEVTKGPFAKIIRTVDKVARRRPMAKLSDVVFVFAYTTRSTPLHRAAYFAALPALSFLLEHGAPVNSTANPKGMTPLHLAVIGGHEDVCALLLVAGADSSIKDKFGRTAVAYAAKFGHDALRWRLQNNTKDQVSVRRREGLATEPIHRSPQTCPSPGEAVGESLSA